MKQTILGAGGSIGNALTYELLKSKEEIRLVSRSKFSIPGTTSIKADITSYQETLDGILGSEIVYLCVGLPYNSSIWNEMWPKIMKNVIDACKSTGAKLIFFDNVYMYGKVDGKMTETTPYNPCTRKGEVRAKIATLLEDEMKQGNLYAIIARAADLYGPYITQNSVPYFMAFEKLLNGKNAQWMVNANLNHSYTFTLDCAKGLNLLSKSKDSFQQIWHLPTYNPAIDGKAFIELIANELGTSPNYSVLKKWMICIAGYFNKTIYESYEMLYQYENDYNFDSTKFNDCFHFNPTSYTQGVHETIEFFKLK